MEQNLDTKLTRIENTVNIMKNNLRLSDNEVIEKVAEATNLHSLANIYIQENEPTGKDGIWIQADPETIPYDTVKIDADILIDGYWRYDNVETYPSYTLGPNELCAINGKFYGIRPYSSQTNLEIWEYDFKTTPYTTQKVYSSTSYKIYAAGSGSYSIQLFTDGTYLYIPDGFCSKGGLYRFDPRNKSCTFIAANPGYDTFGSDCPYYGGGCYNAANNTIYIVGPWGGQLASYDCTTGTASALWAYRNGPKMRYVYPMGETLLCILSQAPYARIWDISAKKLTALDTGLEDESMLPYANFIDMGNYLYAFKGLDKVLKINKADLTYEDVTSDFNKGNIGEKITTVIHDLDHKFIAITANANQQKRFVSMDMNTANYDHNSIVIMQTPITTTEKRTALWTYPNLEGRMCQSFWDVYYYNKDTGFKLNLPTYYGNGTEWIKWK